MGSWFVFPGFVTFLFFIEYEQSDLTFLGNVESLNGIIYLEKAHRLILHWKTGKLEFWNTEQGRRLEPGESLPNTVGWTVFSPDETFLLTGDQTPGLQEYLKGFVPKITLWNTKTGEKKYSFPVIEAKGHPLFYPHFCYAHWLNKSQVVIIRIMRQNEARAAARLRLIVFDFVLAKVIKASEDFEMIGEHFLLSPNRKMALIKDDNYVFRTINGKVGWSYRNINSKLSVIEMDTLKIHSSWREPPDHMDPKQEEGNAFIARWFPDGEKILTVGNAYSPHGHSSPIARIRDARSGQLLHAFSGHTDYIMDIAFAGHKLFTASEDCSIQIWDTRIGKKEKVLRGHTAGLNQVIVLPGEILAVSAAEEPIAKVWDLTTGRLKYDLSIHDSPVRKIEIVSKTVVRTITLKGTITLWDCLTGRVLHVIRQPSDYPKRFGFIELIKKGKNLFICKLK